VPDLYPAGFPNVAVIQQTGTPGVPGTVLTTSNVVPAITTNTTVNVTTTTTRLRQIVINVTGAPSAWLVKIQNAGGTFIIFQQTFNAATTAPIVVNLGDGVTMAGGIQIVTSGTTPGTAYVALNY
jgi:hypothetical protein